jgi:hypothetical protein
MIKSVKNINKTTCKSQNKIATKRKRIKFNRKTKLKKDEI